MKYTFLSDKGLYLLSLFLVSFGLGINNKVKNMFLVDLHNDLLSYIESDPKKHTPFDEETRSSVSQYRASDVRAVALVAFTAVGAPSYHLQLEKQGSILVDLFQKYPDIYQSPFSSSFEEGKITSFFAIEGCSTFSHEDEPLEKSFSRFLEVSSSLNCYPLYASLTWNGVNRFGAGAFSSEDEEKRGLTEDGKRLIDFLFDKVFAFDISHASDTLALDIFDYLETKGYSTKIIASHSNFRKIHESPRNLPDELAIKIKERGGIIGLNCIKPFIGDDYSSLFRHIEHGLTLVGEDRLALGADFFSVACIPANQQSRFKDHFFDELSSAADLIHLFEKVKDQFGQNIARKMASMNALEKLIGPYMHRGPLVNDQSTKLSLH